MATRHICTFCTKPYSRQDALRRHALKCPERGTRALPKVNKGRNRHACVSCTTKKLYCNGSSPCSACAVKGIKCTQDQKEGSATTINTSSQYNDGQRQWLFAFLLCTDEEEVFGERFNFPKPAPSVTDPGHSSFQLEWMDTGLTTCFDFDFDFMEGVFETGLHPMPDYSYSITTRDQLTYNVQLENGRLASIAARIKTAPTVLLLPEPQRQEVEEKVDYFLTYDKAAKFISYYWDLWHWNSRIVHRPSFETVAINEALLTSIIFLGAMYSQDVVERTTASALLEHAASYIYSQPALSCAKDSTEGSGSNAYFQDLQAAFLVVVTEFWTGDESARHRATTQHFDRVVEVMDSSMVLSVDEC